MMKKEDHCQEEWNLHNRPSRSFIKIKPDSEEYSRVEEMKEKFSKLLLGEDSTALALSNAITSLAASVFGELWKLEPLFEDRKSVWAREMDWLLSPAHYMVFLERSGI